MTFASSSACSGCELGTPRGTSPGKKRIASLLDVLFLTGRASSGSQPCESPRWPGRGSLPSPEGIQCLPSLPRIRAWQVTEESVEGPLEHRLVQALHVGSLSRSKGSIIPAGSEESIKTAQSFGGGQLGSGLHVRAHVIWLEKRPNMETGSMASSS